MAQKEKTKILDSLNQLEEAVKFYLSDQAAVPHVKFLAVVKAYEVALEYAWKELKRRVEDEGVEAPSPKETIRQAARLKMIDRAETWLEFIETRNNSVHDYFEVPEQQYVLLAQNFLKKSRRLFG